MYARRGKWGVGKMREFSDMVLGALSFLGVIALIAILVVAWIAMYEYLETRFRKYNDIETIRNTIENDLEYLLRILKQKNASPDLIEKIEKLEPEIIQTITKEVKIRFYHKFFK